MACGLVANIRTVSDRVGFCTDKHQDFVRTPTLQKRIPLSERKITSDTFSKLRHPLYLQPAWSQMSEMLRHSSNGGAGMDPAGRAELYEALKASYSRPPRSAQKKSRLWIKCNLCLRQFDIPQAKRAEVGLRRVTTKTGHHKDSFQPNGHTMLILCHTPRGCTC